MKRRRTIQHIAALLTLGTCLTTTTAMAYPPGAYGPYGPYGPGPRREAIIVTTPIPSHQPPPPRTIDVNVVAQGVTYLQEADRVKIRQTDNNQFALVLHNQKNRLFWLKNRGTANRGAIPISRFVNVTWFKGPLSLANLPPQAMLIGSTHESGPTQFIAAFSLTNPTFQPNRNVTRYDANLVFNNTTYNLNGLVVYHAKLIIN